MRVADGVHIGPHAIEQKMHGHLRGKLPMPGELPPIQIRNNEILGRKRSLVHTGGSGENAVPVEPHRQVSLTGNDMSAFVHPAARDANLAAMLFYTLRVAWQNGFRSHRRTPSWCVNSNPGLQIRVDSCAFRSGVAE